jgi:drug/metabolite transporter (DMT)-like permease
MLLLGSLLAVVSAATFALNNAAVRRGVLTGTVSQAMAITVPMGVPMFFLGALALGHLGDIFGFTPKTVAMLAAAGIIHFVWGRYCNYRATKAIGGNASIPLQQLDFPFKLGLAIVLLGETLTPLRVFGIALIMLGGAIAVPKRRKKAKKEPTQGAMAGTGATEPQIMSVGAAAVPADPAPSAKPLFVPNYKEGYLFAALSVTGYGISPLFIRAALENTSIGTSLAGGFISYVAATLVIMLLWLKPGQFQHVLAVNHQSVKWFLMSAIFVGLSQMTRYMALSLAPITVVAPLQRSASLFRVIFNWLINRQYEIFERRLLVGIFISVLGGMSLALTTDFVVSILPLPDFAREAMYWTWPN